MRAAKLAMARKMLKEHQEKKQTNDKDTEITDNASESTTECTSARPDITMRSHQDQNPSVANPSSVLQHSMHMPQTDTELYEAYNVDTSIDDRIKVDEQLKAVEVLTASKRYLEKQVQEMQNQIVKIEADYSEAIGKVNGYRNDINTYQIELSKCKEDNRHLTEELNSKKNDIENQYKKIASLKDVNNDMAEQLDITKTALMAKEAECGSYLSYHTNLQNKLDVAELRLEQLNHGGVRNGENAHNNIEDIEILIQKVTTLEQQLKFMLKERDQVRNHYEMYVAELNQHLSAQGMENGELCKQINIWRNRESELIEQISDMEIQMQKQLYNNTGTVVNSPSNKEADLLELQQKYKILDDSFIELQRKYEEAEAKVISLTNNQRESEDRDNTERASIAQEINLSKLQADIASDKVAAQIATAQNVQLKSEIEHLKEVNIKMSQDKLELTEKLDAEKFLNRQLTLKLSEIDEKAKDAQTKLMAKDKEMIRLISTYNELEAKMREQASKTNSNDDDSICNVSKSINCSNGVDSEEHSESTCLVKHHDLNNVTEESNNALNITINEGMLKLQDNFLRKMKELAELSDEKHRLEHIIMQLQSETDTICEYVALYQQQRGILKKREEERKEQLQIFETERNRMKSQLDHLSNIISHFAGDEALKQYFQEEDRQKEVSKIIDLVANLKTNHLVDSSKLCTDFSNLYHCSWCSGKIINV